MNFKLIIQYDGTDFHGWQIQGELRTVQAELTRVLSLIDGRQVTVHGSGRTDAGVHAEGQVASVKLEKEITPKKLRAAVNGNVEKDLRVVAVAAVSDDFHARYSATEKTYVYRIVNGPVISPFWVRYAHHEARALNIERMKQSAALFLGEHDWTAFSSVQTDVESKFRTITQVEIRERCDERAQAKMIEFQISANGFLRYMVRSITGAVLAAARGEVTDEQITRAINAGERDFVAATAPARGLTLLSVRYPDF